MHNRASRIWRFLPALPLLEQGVFAFTSLVMTLGVARVGGLRELGILAVGSAVAWTSSALQRALVTEPAMVSSDRRRAKASSLSLFMYAQVLCFLVIAPSAVLGYSLVVAIGLAVLGASAQEQQRFLDYSSHRVGRIFLVNLVTLLLFLALCLVPGLGVLGSGVMATGVRGLTLWMCAGAAVVSHLDASVFHLRTAAMWWWTESRTLSLDQFVDLVGVVLSGHLLLVLLASHDLSEAGDARLTTMLFSPVSLMYGPLILWFLARATLRSPAAARTTVLAALGTGGVGAAYTVFVLVARGPIADQLEQSELSVFHILLVGVTCTSYMAALPLLALLKGWQRMRGVALARIVTGSAACVLLPLGQLWTATAFLVANLIQAVMVVLAALISARPSHRTDR